MPKIQPAPIPSEVIWESLYPVDPMVTAAKASSATLKYYLMLFFFGVPISFVSVLMDLDQLERDFPPLEWLFDFLGDAIRAQIAAFLPNLALIVFMALLPKICAQFAAEHGKANLADVCLAVARPGNHE